MNKVLRFIAKHNLKITLISFLLPILLQLKSIITPPIIALYEKVPSLSQTYDSILSIRNPFHSPKKNTYQETISSITKYYKEKKFPHDFIINMQLIVQELLNIQEETSHQKLKNNIDQTINELEHAHFQTTIKIFENAALFAEEDTHKAKYIGFIAILTATKSEYDAIELYNKALEIDPLNLFVLNNLGQLYTSLKSYANANGVYYSIVEIGKSKKKYNIISLGYSNLGVINLKQEKYPLALKYFTQALNINKKYNLDLSMATQYTNIALTHEKQKEIEKACINYRRARIIFYKHYQDARAKKILTKLKKIKCL